MEKHPSAESQQDLHVLIYTSNMQCWHLTQITQVKKMGFFLLTHMSHMWKTLKSTWVKAPLTQVSSSSYQVCLCLGCSYLFFSCTVIVLPTPPSCIQMSRTSGKYLKRTPTHTQSLEAAAFFLQQAFYSVWGDSTPSFEVTWVKVPQLWPIFDLSCGSQWL